MKSVELPPYAPTLIESTRAIGYSLEAAIADIIDNSIAAGASNVDLYFFPIDEEYVAILDNGRGMDENELTSAMQYGSKNPLEERSKEDLGRFGLGHLPMIFDAKWQNFCVRKIPMPMPVQAQGS